MRMRGGVKCFSTRGVEVFKVHLKNIILTENSSFRQCQPFQNEKGMRRLLLTTGAKLILHLKFL